MTKTDFIFTFTDPLTSKEVARTLSYRGSNIEKWVMQSVKKLFTTSVEIELKAYFGETLVAVRSAIDGVIVCSAVLDTNVFSGHTDATYRFHKTMWT